MTPTNQNSAQLIAAVLQKREMVENTHAATLDGLIEADLADRRACFAEPLRHAPLDVLLDAVRQACTGGFGIWTEPDQPATHRPATHLFEIHLLGLTATGASPAEAARNWRHAVLAQIDAQPERTPA